MSDNLKEVLLDVLLVLFVCFCLTGIGWLITWLITYEPSYYKLIKVCEKIGMFYINENTTIKCEVLK
jgi:hypothetical protein